MRRRVTVMHKVSGLGLSAALLVSSPRESPAQAASEFDQCVTFHLEAQRLRQESQLLEARRMLRNCSAPSCPSLLRSDCSSWMEDVEQRIPSVIFHATVDARPWVATRILEGKRVLTEAITGVAIEFDPGPHTFTAERANGQTMERTYVLREGEKNRLIQFDFVAPETQVRVRSESPPASQPARPIPTTTYVFGATALAAAATGATFGILAMGERSSVDDECSPLCSDEEVKSFENLALYADVSFGVAALSAGLATYFFLTRPYETERRAPTAFRAQPTLVIHPELMGLGVRGNF